MLSRKSCIKYSIKEVISYLDIFKITLSHSFNDIIVEQNLTCKETHTSCRRNGVKNN